MSRQFESPHPVYEYPSDRALLLALQKDVEALRKAVDALCKHLGVTAPSRGTYPPYR